MNLAEGGHLTHGSAVNLSGKWFKPVSYGVDPVTHLIDYDKVAALAQEHKPKLIVAGASSYSRAIDFKRFREIADSVGAFFWVDMAHYAGLVAAGLYPDPLPHAHVVTTTTHKTLRGPRGGLILSNDVELGKKLNSAVFPGMQGGPLMHVIAAKAVAFGEALRPEFKVYCQEVAHNAKVANAFFSFVFLKPAGSCGGDHCWRPRCCLWRHRLPSDARRPPSQGVLLLVVCSFAHATQGLTGKAAEQSLERAGITCNKNAVPNDPEKPMVTSGIRLGTPASTTRGFGEAEFRQVRPLYLISPCSFASGRSPYP
jgi:glycine hydroxymethyltransferase